MTRSGAIALSDLQGAALIRFSSAAVAKRHGTLSKTLDRPPVLGAAVQEHAWDRCTPRRGKGACFYGS